MRNATSTIDPESYASQFEAVIQRTEPAWIAAMRRAAMLRFQDLGFPTRSHEEWRFTNPALLAETPFVVADSEEDARTLKESPGAFKSALTPFAAQPSGRTGLAFLNGRNVPMAAGLSPDVDGAGILPIAQLLAGSGHSETADLLSSNLAHLADFQSHAFAALNTAFFEDGAFVYIPANAVIETPIEIIYVSGGGADGVHPMSSPRTFIYAGENSRATVVETYTGLRGGRRLTNSVTEVYVSDSAEIDHYKVCDEAADAFHVGTKSVRLGQSCRFTSHSLTLGGGLVRNQVGAVLMGEHSECTLNGLYLAEGSQLVDNHTSIDHAMPNCDSHEVYKGILGGKAHGVFNGKIFVRLDAQKTDAKQTNKTLLLSRDARIDTKPQLEIFADDVKCTHGATVGQLDENQVFYLRTRGMTEAAARNLLTYAFAGEIVQRIKVDALRNAVDERLLAMLPGS